MEGGGGVSFLWVTETPHPIDHRWWIKEETGGGWGGVKSALEVCLRGGGGVSKSAWGMELGHTPGPRLGPSVVFFVLLHKQKSSTKKVPNHHFLTDWLILLISVSFIFKPTVNSKSNISGSSHLHLFYHSRTIPLFLFSLFLHLIYHPLSILSPQTYNYRKHNLPFLSHYTILSP